MALLDHRALDADEGTRPWSSSLGYPYVMMAVAIGCLCISGVLGSIFDPDFVSTSGTSTGTTLQHTPVAAFSGWIWPVIAMAMMLSAAMQGIRAKVIARLPWTLLGLGVGGIWLAVMFVAMFAPVMVSGSAPWLTWTPLGEIFAVIGGIILTWILCHFVKTTFFEPAQAQRQVAPAEVAAPVVSPPSAADDVTTKLRQLAQLHDAGVITDAEFQTKKDDLLSRM
ncbi:MAG TPA: SHOCT domain-containing protein [Acidimicrobiales bacterium]|nr:SHOCT domain-containing protein [Acidimicrobiales bacterium]